MLTGSVAATMYGEPRVTHDVDVVLLLPRERIRAFAAAFPLETHYCPPEETLLQEVFRRQRGHFNLIAHDTGFKADVYLANADPLHRAGLQDRRRVEVDGVEVWIAPPEYVIVRKLEFFREGGLRKASTRHRGDAPRLLRAPASRPSGIVDRQAGPRRTVGAGPREGRILKLAQSTNRLRRPPLASLTGGSISV